MGVAIVPWAQLALYPAGAPGWSGTSTKVAPAATYLTPESPAGLSAQNLNFIWNQRDAILASLAMGVWATAVANWNRGSSNVGGPVVQNGPTAAWWDAYSGQWMLPCQVSDPSVASTLMLSADGKTWKNIAGGVTGSTGRVGFAVATNPTTGDICLYRSDGSTTSSISRWAAGTGAAVDTVQAFLAGVDQGVMTYWNGGFVFVGATNLLGNNWTGALATSTTGSGAWTDAHTALPTGFASGTGNPVLEWMTAQNASTLVVAMCGKTVGTSTSRLMSQSSASPGTWTDITPSALGGTAQQIRGLTYASNDGLWGLLSVDAANTYLYTSPDLATWTLVHTFTGYSGYGVATIGSVWAVLAWWTALGQGGPRVLYSTDVVTDQASSVWQYGAYSEDTSGQSVPSNVACQFLSNGQQILRCEILRVNMSGVPGGMVASSSVAGFVGSVPITPILSTAPQVIKLTHANSPVGTPQKPALYGPAIVKVDVSGGTVEFDLGLAGVEDGTEMEFVNTNGSFATSSFTLIDSSGRTFEDPANPLTFNATRVLGTAGMSVTYMLDADNARWKIV